MLCLGRKNDYCQRQREAVSFCAIPRGQTRLTCTFRNEVTPSLEAKQNLQVIAELMAHIVLSELLRRDGETPELGRMYINDFGVLSLEFCSLTSLTLEKTEQTHPCGEVRGFSRHGKQLSPSKEWVINTGSVISSYF